MYHSSTFFLGTQLFFSARVRPSRHAQPIPTMILNFYRWCNFWFNSIWRLRTIIFECVWLPVKTSPIPEDLSMMESVSTLTRQHSIINLIRRHDGIRSERRRRKILTIWWNNNIWVPQVEIFWMMGYLSAAGEIFWTLGWNICWVSAAGWGKSRTW